MKTKYLEVEVLPFSILPENNPGFAIRHLSKEYDPTKKKTLNLQKISFYLFRTTFILLLAFFPLFSFGQITFKQEIIKLTNIERNRQHLPLLTDNPLLDAAALAKANDMIALNYFSHTSPSGLSPWNFITENGYEYKFAGENLALDFSDPQNAMTAWLRSPSHRDNILDPDFKEIGVAVVKGTVENQETVLVVQFFGTR
ncbi:MAG: CAP domain-containing protein [Patescibacteria group bacterium]